LPQARHSFDSARALYRGTQGDALGMLDALRSLVDVRLERERARARVEAALADVERAIGGPLPPGRAASVSTTHLRKGRP
jgi:outer membrane protein TolC